MGHDFYLLASFLKEETRETLLFYNKEGVFTYARSYRYNHTIDEGCRRCGVCGIQYLVPLQIDMHGSFYNRRKDIRLMSKIQILEDHHD